MVKLQVIRLSDSDVTALYRRFPDMSAPQPCRLSLNLDDGSFSASYDDHRGSQATRPADQGRVLRWSIPCLTAIAANNVLEELAWLAEQVLAADAAGGELRLHAGMTWDGRSWRAMALNDDAAFNAHLIKLRCRTLTGRAGNPGDPWYDNVIRTIPSGAGIGDCIGG